MIDRLWPIISCTYRNGSSLNVEYLMWLRSDVEYEAAAWSLIELARLLLAGFKLACKMTSHNFGGCFQLDFL